MRICCHCAVQIICQTSGLRTMLQHQLSQSGQPPRSGVMVIQDVEGVLGPLMAGTSVA